MGRRNWLFGTRSTEATPDQLVVTGAGGGAMFDPIDGDVGFRRLGEGPREQPQWTTEKARAFSVAAYRANPMARAVIDTYVSFTVGDSGIKLQCTEPSVRAIAEPWWNDPRNAMEKIQPLLCRDWLLQGEAVWEYLVGQTTGVTRFSPIDPARITKVHLDRGNPLWHRSIEISGVEGELTIAALDDVSELRVGRIGYFPSWRALITDRRGVPFLSPVLDDLDAYSQVLSNLVDRTALARYIAYDVTVKGGSKEVDDFIKARGGVHVPRSGSIEVHNEGIEWKPMQVSSGSAEDTQTALSVLTNVAGGAGLAKTWLAESEGANRATSLSMAEPVRRRVGGVQREWLDIMTEHARFAIDQAVAVGRLPKMIATTDAGGNEVQLPPAQLVRVVGPQIAAADAQVTAQVMLNLATGLEKLVAANVLTKDAAALAAEKAWEQFVGTPLPRGLAVTPGTNEDDVAAEIDAANAEGRLFRVA